MERKKVITILNQDHVQNQSVINFLHKHFRACQIDAVFAKLPEEKNEKRLGDHFKAIVANSPAYYDSNNRYKLLSTNEILVDEPIDFRYYDVVVQTKDSFDFLRNSTNLNYSLLPSLVVPNNFDNRIENVIFISTDSENRISGFKNFCYLFPTLCSESESVLLRIVKEDDEKSVAKNERLLYDYLKTKCAHLSIHKVEGSLHEVDKKVLNLTNSTLIVTDKQGVDYENVLNYTGDSISDFTLFKAS